MLICAKMERSRSSPLNDFRLRFWRLFFSFSFSIWLSDRLDFLLQTASSSSSTILVYLSFFQNFLIHSKKFIAKRCDPDSFKCKPIRFKCLLMIFLLSTMSIFNCGRWLVNWFTVSVAFRLSECSVDFEINILQSGNFSCICDLKFRSLFNVSLDVEKTLTLTFRPPPHDPSSKTPLAVHSPTTDVVFFDHCHFSVVIFSLAVLLWSFF